MRKTTNQFLYWTPRILGILFAAFLTLFSFDAFGGEESIWNQLLGFLFHNIPVYLVAIVLFIAWKRELAGGILFFCLTLFFVVWMWGGDWSASLGISGPLGFIGVLFLLNWKYRDELSNVNNLPKDNE